MGLRWVGGAIALVLLTLLLVTVLVNYATGSRRFKTLGLLPARPVAIIFGAGVWEDGTPSPMLADRVLAGVELYQQGKVERLLMSGDHQNPDYNEVDPMIQLARESGVPEAAILSDRLGLSTYDTCRRARDHYGIRQAILVSQRYHLPRAIYIAQRLGLDVMGYGVADWGVYRYRSMLSYQLREVIALCKAIAQTRSHA
ncbi:SanA/YdcF family protein [Sodalinema gerasimenkoae]|uniref:SanA/YdcF family protein n=1 Tax=Sodalinema gerasimenkoae TaxID=2862348 RepID=UPI0013596329|nr:ElyC/SanA/YdcF family protein [Sodalinema gerasimenkoae]